MANITTPQIRKIYVTARDLGICNELLHTYIFNLTGQEHISALTKKEAMKIIDGLEVRRMEKEEENIPGRATKPQQKLINQLVKRLNWEKEPWRLKGFLKKYAKVEEVKWLTPRQASNIIEGLKKVLEREKKSLAKAKGE